MTPADDPLTPEEESFRDLLSRPGELSKFAAWARQRWERTPEGKAAVARCYKTVGGFRQKTEKESA